MAGGSFQHGFKAKAERVAQDLRGELGLSSVARLDPRVLADHLAIPVLELGALTKAGAKVSSVSHFHGEGSAAFSAVTIVDGYRRVVVVNDSHAAVRQTSSISHEISHVVLEHEPHKAIDSSGCRLWKKALELEADWLGGVLLVPRDGALHALREGLELTDAAAHFGVSTEMMRWRIDNSGARVQVKRELAKGGRRTR